MKTTNDPHQLSLNQQAEAAAERRDHENRLAR